ncbi:MAG: selenocysteine-specific translation elongation factor [Dorea sp.]|nr:selenocysteine-specific translation elongation factor [Dorea sp.]
MKNIIIGTAGHIDHGKTTLIKALTGRNTDRWEEEQKRGITIDLGFTWFDLPSGNRAGIIDVPGHERFINNMVAGVVGMDLVMLVIAADEGVMPQTREHMDILGLLGIEKSIIVLNKCDLVEEDWVELVEEEIKEELAGTFLEQAPVVKVSAAAKEGLDELVNRIDYMMMEEVAGKDIATIPRLPIDRVFSLSGFGTIITGTLLSGTISKEDVLAVYPVGKTSKIRSIQVHGEDKDRCYAGQRVAINLSGLKKRELFRGCVLAPPDSMKNTDLLDVKMDILKSSMRVLTNHARLHLFTGTSEVLCRAVLLNQDEIGPGESGYVQLRLEEKIALRRGDKFVVRFYSPMETIGGGVVLEPNPSIHRRRQETVIEDLKRKESGSSSDIIEMHVREHGDSLATQAELAKLTALSVEEVTEALQELKSSGEILLFATRKDVYVWHVGSERLVRQKILDALVSYEEKYPYRYGMKKAEVQVTFLKKMKPVIFDQYVEYLEQKGAVKRVEEYLCTTDYQVCKDELYRRISEQILDTVKRAKYDFVRYSDMSFTGVSRETVDDILNILLEERQVVKVSDDLYTLTGYMEQARAMIQEEFTKRPVITTAEVRDLFQTSRKSAKPIIEYMDSIKVTKRAGAESERVAY